MCSATKFAGGFRQNIRNKKAMIMGAIACRSSKSRPPQIQWVLTHYVSSCDTCSLYAYTCRPTCNTIRRYDRCVVFSVILILAIQSKRRVIPLSMQKANWIGPRMNCTAHQNLVAWERICWLLKPTSNGGGAMGAGRAGKCPPSILWESPGGRRPPQKGAQPPPPSAPPLTSSVKV